jgi:hypothetical protein
VDFPRGLRVFRFRSALWAPRVPQRPARGCGRGSWEGRSGAFPEPSILGVASLAQGGVPARTGEAAAYPLGSEDSALKLCRVGLPTREQPAVRRKSIRQEP